MVYVKRDGAGKIVAVSRETGDAFDEQVPLGDQSLGQFVNALQPQRQGVIADLQRSDREFIRVLEDVVDLLEEKGLISLEELPQDAHDKLVQRRTLRRRLREPANQGSAGR